MAGVDARNSLAGLPSPADRPMAPERVQALREAQRAFFQAALAGDPAAPQPAAPPEAAPKRAAAPTTAVAPDGLLRPGSLVDVKV